MSIRGWYLTTHDCFLSLNPKAEIVKSTEQAASILCRFWGCSTLHSTLIHTPYNFIPNFHQSGNKSTLHPKRRKQNNALLLSSPHPIDGNDQVCFNRLFSSDWCRQWQALVQWLVHVPMSFDGGNLSVSRLGSRWSKIIHKQDDKKNKKT